MAEWLFRGLVNRKENRPIALGLLLKRRLHKMVEKLSESSELDEILKLVQEVAIKILSQISSIKT